MRGGTSRCDAGENGKNEKAPVRREPDTLTKPTAPLWGAVGFVLLRVQRKEEHLGEENDQEEVMMIEVKQTECTPAPKASAV